MGIALAAAATTEIEMAQLLTIVFVFLICSFTPSPNLVQLLDAFPAHRGAFVCIALHPVAMPIVPCALQMACVQKSQKQSFLPRFMFHSLQLSAILCCISGLLKCTALQHSALRCRALQWESLWQWQQEQKLKWCNCWQWFLSCCFVFSSITQSGAILACFCAHRGALLSIAWHSVATPNIECASQMLFASRRASNNHFCPASCLICSPT